MVKSEKWVFTADQQTNLVDWIVREWKKELENQLFHVLSQKRFNFGSDLTELTKFCWQHERQNWDQVDDDLFE